MIRISELYPTRTISGLSGYPYGAAQDQSATQEGTRLTPAMISDIWGMQAALLAAAPGFRAASGVPDDALRSELLDALRALSEPRGGRYELQATFALGSAAWPGLLRLLTASPDARHLFGLVRAGGEQRIQRMDLRLPGDLRAGLIAGPSVAAPQGEVSAVAFDDHGLQMWLVGAARVQMLPLSEAWNPASASETPAYVYEHDDADGILTGLAWAPESGGLQLFEVLDAEGRQAVRAVRLRTPWDVRDRERRAIYSTRFASLTGLAPGPSTVVLSGQLIGGGRGSLHQFPITQNPLFISGPAKIDHELEFAPGGIVEGVAWTAAGKHLFVGAVGQLITQLGTYQVSV